MFVIQMIARDARGRFLETWVDAIVAGSFEEATDRAVNNTVLKYYGAETMAYNEKEQFAVYRTLQADPRGGFTEVDVYEPHKMF